LRRRHLCAGNEGRQTDLTAATAICERTGSVREKKREREMGEWRGLREVFAAR